MFSGSRSHIGCLLEGAFDALLIWEGLFDPPPVPIRRRQTLFSVLLAASRGLQLQTIPIQRTAGASGCAYPSGVSVHTVRSGGDQNRDQLR
jgi:hypothetical protein